MAISFCFWMSNLLKYFCKEVNVLLQILKNAIFSVHLHRNRLKI